MYEKMLPLRTIEAKIDGFIVCCIVKMNL